MCDFHFETGGGRRGRPGVRGRVARGGVWLLVAGLWAFAAGRVMANPLPRAEWGIDGCITVHVSDEADFDAYVQLLEESGVRWVRERTVLENEKIKARLAKMQAAGLHTLAFARTPGAPPPARAGNQLTEDLLAVYRAGYRQARGAAGLVDVWELPNEPDIFYVKDLPERYVAYSKALYLGLHDGAASVGKPVTVLMGAMALPPGPWLQRAAANGIYDYTDAGNIHFYGLASAFPGVLAAHRAFMRQQVDLRTREPIPMRVLRYGEDGWRPFRPNPGHPMVRPKRPAGLPIWVTECGVDVMDKADLLNPERLAYQADFIAETARAAWKAPDLAVFMPFILYWKNRGYTMTLSPRELLPEWKAYEKIVRSKPWIARTLVQPPKNPSRVVLQWLPADGQGNPHKVAGTYRFEAGETMRGEIRLYNFDQRERRGRIEWTALENVNLRFSPAAELTVPAMGSVVIPVDFTPRRARGYFREEWRLSFVPVEKTERASPLAFGLERRPQAEDFALSPLLLKQSPGRDWLRYQLPGGREFSARGPWRGVNGVEVLMDGGAEAYGIFQVKQRYDHPYLAPMAIARVRGLPAKGFLRVTLGGGAFRSDYNVRVDLMDDKGQRFTLWENHGLDSQGHNDALWMSFEDFHRFFWGQTHRDSFFDPSRVVQVQVRLFIPDETSLMAVRIEVAEPKTDKN